MTSNRPRQHPDPRVCTSTFSVSVPILVATRQVKRRVLLKDGPQNLETCSRKAVVPSPVTQTAWASGA